MSVKIMIERKFKEGVGPENLKTINTLRVGALRRQGYISGETLVSLEDKREVLVISHWSSFEDWQAWRSAPEREKLEKMLSPDLEGPTVIREFMSGAEALKEVFEEIVHEADAQTAS